MDAIDNMAAMEPGLYIVFGIIILAIAMLAYWQGAINASKKHDK